MGQLTAELPSHFQSSFKMPLITAASHPGALMRWWNLLCEHFITDITWEMETLSVPGSEEVLLPAADTHFLK